MAKVCDRSRRRHCEMEGQRLRHTECRASERSVTAARGQHPALLHSRHSERARRRTLRCSPRTIYHSKLTTRNPRGRDGPRPRSGLVNRVKIIGGLSGTETAADKHPLSIN